MSDDKLQSTDAGLPRVPSVRTAKLETGEPTDLPAAVESRPALPIVAMAWTEGGMLAARIPSVQSGVIENAEVSDEYRELALDTARQALIYLGQEDMPVRVVFIKDPNRPPTNGPRIVYEGFVAQQHPGVVFIYADETSLERLPRIVVHEVAHLVFNASHLKEGSAPWEDSPSERFAHELADRMFGPDPDADRRAELARQYAQSVGMPRNVMLPSGEADVEDGSITVVNAGSVVIIDGSSDLFKIAATGTTTTPAISAGQSFLEFNLTLSLAGYTAAPAYLGYVNFGGATGAVATLMPYVDWDNSTGKMVRFLNIVTVVPDSSHVTVSRSAMSSTGSSATTAKNVRYYVLKEEAV